MQRRTFLKTLGATSAGLTAYAAASGTEPAFKLPALNSFEDLKTRRGEYLLRLTFRHPEDPGIETEAVSLSLAEGSIRDRHLYPFYPDAYYLDPRPGEGFRLDVMSLILTNVTAESVLTISMAGSQAMEFALSEVYRRSEVIGSVGAFTVTANFLRDVEIAEIDPTRFGMEAQGEEWSFVAMADPQGGTETLPHDPSKRRTRLRVHNAFTDETVDLINRLKQKPAFTAVIGDITDAWGADYDFAAMQRMLSPINSPILYTIGNHESSHRIDFEPGYRSEAFANYFQACQGIGSPVCLCGSFNLGNWHFIIWPDPLRSGFFETRPHFFDWLRADLAAHRDRPTIVFHHVPAHPVGIDPLIAYCESVEVKRTFLDLLATHGNVKLLLSGHVHIPIKASHRTAATYRGMRMINLPAAGYRPRAFGEADYAGGPSQGAAVVELKGEEVQVTFKNIVNEEYPYEAKPPPLDEERHALWLKQKWELPAAATLQNGSFAKGLRHWVSRYCYEEEEDPANVAQSRQLGGQTALYLRTHTRGHLAPGQDRLPQSLNRVCQAIALPPERRYPQVTLRYLIDPAACDLDGLAGAHLWIEGFSGSRKRLSLVYVLGRHWYSIGGNYSQNEQAPYMFYDLPLEGDAKPLEQVEDSDWQEVTLNLAADAERHPEISGPAFEALSLDRLVINMGVWTANDGLRHGYGVAFTGLQVALPAVRPAEPSRTRDGNRVEALPKAREWWRGKEYQGPSNLAGEHLYMATTKRRL